jgi:hypothetical protein
VLHFGEMDYWRIDIKIIYFAVSGVFMIFMAAVKP